MGYDISDYEDIDPMYGTLADVDHLIKEMKSRGMKLMMDLVVNHTSDQVSHFLTPRFQQQPRPPAISTQEGPPLKTPHGILQSLDWLTYPDIF